jgi:hypothetical protein
VVIVLTTGPKFHGFKPGQGYGFLRAIKISSRTSFGGEVKPSAHVRILWHVKVTSKYEQRNFWGLPERSGRQVRS